MSIESSDSEAEYHSYSERTLAIIKPEAYEDAEAIENHIRNHGFSILARREVRLTPEQAAELYRGHYGRHHFPHLVAQMSSGPIVAMVLACRGCIQKWRTLMGPARVVEAQAYWPDSLRACYGRRTKYGDYFNALHGSKDHAEALREIHFFFPDKPRTTAEAVRLMHEWADPDYPEYLLTEERREVEELYFCISYVIVGPLLRHWQVNDYVQKHLASTLEPALSALARERPAEPVLWLAHYLQKNNPNEPLLGPATHEIRDEPQCHTPLPSETSERK